MFPKEEPIGQEDPLLAYKASANPDILYMHEAMKYQDQKELITSIKKEVTDQTDNGNSSAIPNYEVPKEAKVIPAVWQMKSKRDIKIRKVKKWKTRLNIDGSRTKKGFTR